MVHGLGSVDIEARRSEKNKKEDRAFLLAQMEGKKGQDSSGLVDPRLFTGDNKLHAVKEKDTCLWYLKYEHGSVPVPFRQRFTHFYVLEKFVRDYYAKRNIEVKEIID